MNQLALFNNAERDQGPRAFGLAWYVSGNRQMWRPFQIFRPIKKGKHKGLFEITFFNGRKKIIGEHQVKYFPDGKED